MNRDIQLVIAGVMERSWPNQKWDQEAKAEFTKQTSDLDDDVSMEVVNYCVQHEEFRPSIAKFRDHHMRIAKGKMGGFHREERTMSEKDLMAAQFFGPRLTEITGSPVWSSISGTGARNQGDKVRGRSGGMFAGDPDEGELIRHACNGLIGEWAEICERHGWEYIDPRQPSER